jgi:hypothetical protein
MYLIQQLSRQFNISAPKNKEKAQSKHFVFILLNAGSYQHDPDDQRYHSALHA